MTVWRTIFIAAGLFNLAVAIPMLAAPDLMFAAFGAASLSHPLYTPSLGWMIAVFGAGYLLVARDLARNRDIALIGALGKLGFVAIAWTAAAARGCAGQHRCPGVGRSGLGIAVSRLLPAGDEIARRCVRDRLRMRRLRAAERFFVAARRPRAERCWRHRGERPTPQRRKRPGRPTRPYSQTVSKAFSPPHRSPKSASL